VLGAPVAVAAAAAEAPTDSLPDFKRLAWQDLRILMTRSEENEFLALPDRTALANGSADSGSAAIRRRPRS